MTPGAVLFVSLLTSAAFHAILVEKVINRGEIEMGRTFCHLSYEQRVKIRKMLDEGESKSEIAREIGVDRTTIYREIEKGMREGAYDPTYAEGVYRGYLTEKGPKAKLEYDEMLALHIADMILNKSMSPKKIELQLKQEPEYAERCVTAQTIYFAIDKGWIPGVTRETLQVEDVVVSTDGTVCIPKWVLKRLDLKIGDMMHLEVTDDGKIVYQRIEE